MGITVTVVAERQFGFVTDLGEPALATAPDGTVMLRLPRYGVWKPSPRRKYEVVLTTDHLDTAIAEASRPGRPHEQE